MGGGTGSKGGYKTDDAEGMCETTLEPDPRYTGCCSNICRPGRVLRDVVVGFLVVLAIAVVIGVLFAVCFYLVPAVKDGESAVEVEEGALLGGPVEEETNHNTINEVEFTDNTRYDVAPDPKLGNIMEDEMGHDEHHHVGPTPHPEPESEPKPDPKSEPEPEPESEPEPEPESEPDPESDHIHKDDKGHINLEGEGGHDHMHPDGEISHDHIHPHGEMNHDHIHPDGETSHDHMHPDGKMSHDHIHPDGEMSHDHIHPDGEMSHDHIHPDGEMSHDHIHPDGEMSHDHIHPDGEMSHDHIHPDGEMSHDHIHPDGEMSHDHIHPDGEMSHDHIHPDGEMSHDHIHPDGEMSHDHMHHHGEIDQEHFHPEGEMSHNHSHTDEELSHEHTHQDGANHDHLLPEEDLSHNQTHPEGEMSDDHPHSDGEMGQEHVHLEEEISHDHTHTEGEMSHKHANQDAVNHDHLPSEEELGHNHSHPEGEMRDDHLHPEGNIEHGHKLDNAEHTFTPEEREGHTLEGPVTSFAPSEPANKDDSVVVASTPLQESVSPVLHPEHTDVSVFSDADSNTKAEESKSNVTSLVLTTLEEVREEGGLPPLITALSPHPDTPRNFTDVIPREKPQEIPEDKQPEGTLKELTFPEDLHEEEDPTILPEAHPELSPITTEEEAPITDVPEEEPALIEEVPLGTCRPRQLEMCDILPYTLTAYPNWANDHNETELQEASLPFFRDVIVRSRCSPRAQEYACAILEPPCNADGKILPPCKTFCRSVASTCQEFISSGFSLSNVFNCEQFPDSTDPTVCSDMTREPCMGLEHRCGDGQCVAKKLVCDGLSDCLDRSDEAACPGRIPAPGGMADAGGFKMLPQLRSPDLPQDIPTAEDYATEEHGFPTKEYPIAGYSDYEVAQEIPVTVDHPNTGTNLKATASPTTKDYPIATDYPTGNLDHQSAHVDSSVDYTAETLPLSGGNGAFYDGKETALGDTQTEFIPEETLNPSGDLLVEASENLAADGNFVSSSTPPIICDHDNFLCKDGSDCVILTAVCDGIQHCNDGSDEFNCTHIGCTNGDFRCATTDFCIPVSWVCDGADDCHDNSDETDCDAHPPSLAQIPPAREHLEALTPLGQFPLPGSHPGNIFHEEGVSEFKENFSNSGITLQDTDKLTDEEHNNDELFSDDIIQSELIPSQEQFVEVLTVNDNPVSVSDEEQLHSEGTNHHQQFSHENPRPHETISYGSEQLSSQEQNYQDQIAVAALAQYSSEQLQEYPNSPYQYKQHYVDNAPQKEDNFSGSQNYHDGLSSSFNQPFLQNENPLQNEGSDQVPSTQEEFSLFPEGISPQLSEKEFKEISYEKPVPFQPEEYDIQPRPAQALTEGLQTFSGKDSLMETHQPNSQEQLPNNSFHTFQENLPQKTTQPNTEQQPHADNFQSFLEQQHPSQDLQSSLEKKHPHDDQRFSEKLTLQENENMKLKADETTSVSEYFVTKNEKVTTEASLEEPDTYLKEIDPVLPIINVPEEAAKSERPTRFRGSTRFSNIRRPFSRKPSETPDVNSTTSSTDSESNSGSLRYRFQHWRNSRLPLSPAYESLRTTAVRHDRNSVAVSNRDGVKETEVTHETQSTSRLRNPPRRPTTHRVRLRPTIRTSRISHNVDLFPQEEFLKEGIIPDIKSTESDTVPKSTESDTLPTSNEVNPITGQEPLSPPVQGPSSLLPSSNYHITHNENTRIHETDDIAADIFVPQDKIYLDLEPEYDHSVTYDSEQETDPRLLEYRQDSFGYDLNNGHSPIYLPYTPNQSA
ncbi:uncharacterized protein [Panulirus ornatus]|uniref:uncharacterized protein isoform X2 n=1 Tax=Panulirus ornatus TaxID=150431 RepID=UPI003A848AFD